MECPTLLNFGSHYEQIKTATITGVGVHKANTLFYNFLNTIMYTLCTLYAQRGLILYGKIEKNELLNMGLEWNTSYKAIGPQKILSQRTIYAQKNKMTMEELLKY